jgi:Putative AphA-like transcriptional regulator
MQPSDVACIVVLGVASDRPMSSSGVTQIAQALAPHDWQPTADMIGLTVDRAVSANMLAFSGSDGTAEPTFQTTEHGRERMDALLRLPITASTGGFMRTCVRVKLAFLRHLPAHERVSIGAALVQLYQSEFSLPQAGGRDLSSIVPTGLHDQPLPMRQEGPFVA